MSSLFLNEKQKAAIKGIKIINIQILNYNVKMLSSLAVNVRGDDRARRIPMEIKKKFPNVDFVVIEELFEETAERIFDRGMKSNGFPFKSKKVGKVQGVKQLVKNIASRATCEVEKLFDPKKSCKGQILKGIDDGGVKIYSKHRIISQQQTIFKQGSKEDEFAKKGSVRITVMKDGQKIHIIGTHAQSGQNPKEMRIKKTQFKQIRIDLIDKLPNNEPILVSGDFNLDPIKQNPDYQEVMKIMGTKQLRGPLIGSTSTDFNTGKIATENRLLDHIIRVDNKAQVTGIYAIRKLRVEPYRLPNNFRKKIIIGDIEKALEHIGRDFERVGRRALCELDNLNPFSKKRNCAAEQTNKTRKIIKEQLAKTHLARDLSDHQPVIAHIKIKTKL